MTLDDIQLANELAHAILGCTLDEMPPQTRKLLNLLKTWVTAQSEAQSLKQGEYRFSRRDVRAYTHWGDTQLKIHLGRLVEMEYLLLYRKGLSYEYSLLYGGEDNGETYLCGLLDVAQLAQDISNKKAAGKVKWSGVSENRSEQTEKRSAPGRGSVRV